VADPFHLVKLANTTLDECRRRVQNETLGYRGPKSDPLCRCRRLLTKAKERLDHNGHEKLVGLLAAGDPHGDVATMWQAKEAVRELYAHGDPDLALQWVSELGRDLQDKDCPIEARGHDAEEDHAHTAGAADGDGLPTCRRPRRDPAPTRASEDAEQRHAEGERDHRHLDEFDACIVPRRALTDVDRADAQKLPREAEATGYERLPRTVRVP
jgi:hypothetical protein